jgi:hypothetical protein
VSWAEIAAIAFGAWMLGFAAYWVRFGRRARRMGDPITGAARRALGVRVGAYLTLGICAVMFGITGSLWFALIAIAAVASRFLAETYLRGRAHRENA